MIMEDKYSLVYMTVNMIILLLLYYLIHLYYIFFNNFLLTRQRLKRLYFLIRSSSCENIFVSFPFPLLHRAHDQSHQTEVHPHRQQPIHRFLSHLRPGIIPGSN